MDQKLRFPPTTHGLASCKSGPKPEERDMSTTTLVMIGVIIALCVPYVMRRRARLGRQKNG